MKAVSFVEVDIDFCSLTYGVAPCTASIPATGDRKCFNTLATCQDRAHFTNAPVTLRFTEDSGLLLESGVSAIPSLVSVDYSPAIISLGEDLGQRASMRVTFKDHPWGDTTTGFDKYRADRDYAPFDQGSFWGKFRARQPYLRGCAIRLIQGEVGQALADMETHHLVIDSFTGPDADGQFTIVAKDGLKLADGDRAQAPVLSPGFLNAGITDIATAATLAPSGIGNASYPASGFVAIGGKEVCAFTRSGDALTLTRAQHGTVGVAHSSQDRAQVCLVYSGDDVADIIADLLETYAGVPSGNIPLAAWQEETGAFLRRVYSAVIAEPTPVRTLINELIAQAGLAVWWDDIGNQVRLQVLRQIATDVARFNDSNILEGSFTVREQPEKRVSEVQTYFGQKTPFDSPTDEGSFRSSAWTVDAEAASDYGSPAIKKIFSRWISTGGRTVATRVNDIQLGRFRDPPRRFSFNRFRAGPVTPVLGAGGTIEARTLQDDTGARELVPIQIVRLKPTATVWEIEAEEANFASIDEEDLDNRVIILDANQNGVNWRTLHDALYPTPISGDVVTLIVETGVIIGATAYGLPALDTGTWPAGVTLNLQVNGRIQGAGAAGGIGAIQSGADAEDGARGGTALKLQADVVVTDLNGDIWAGGAGGGGAGVLNLDQHRGGGGGGGAGIPPGPGGEGPGSAENGEAGTQDAGGQGGRSYASYNWYTAPYYTGTRGGTGGAPGLAGANGANHGGNSSEVNSRGLGGPQGYAIEGFSYITSNPGGAGDRRGLTTG